MANQIPPPVPPSYQPTGTNNNPYEFITNSAPSPKKSLFGGSKNKRILIVAAGASILLIIVIIFASILSSAGAGLKQDYLTLVQQQNELIRISEIGEKNARNGQAKNLAITTKLSLISSQASITSLAKKAGAPTDAKSIALGRNTETDTKLTQADQSNQFDEVFIETLEEMLAKYRQAIKKVHGQITNNTNRKILQTAHDDAVLLSTPEAAE